MVWPVVATRVALTAKAGLKAYKKYKKNKDVIKSKEYLKSAKETAASHIHGGHVVAGKWAVKTSKKIARNKVFKSLKAKLKNIWSNPN